MGQNNDSIIKISYFIKFYISVLISCLMKAYTRHDRSICLNKSEKKKKKLRRSPGAVRDI